MVRFEARVEITHLPGILDPQGATVERALPALGYDNVSEVRVGKSIRLVLEAPDESVARKLLRTRNPIGATFQLPASPGAPQHTFEIIGLVEDGGLEAIDVGPLVRAREVEAMGFLHIKVQDQLGTGFGSALKVVR